MKYAVDVIQVSHSIVALVAHRRQDHIHAHDALHVGRRTLDFLLRVNRLLHLLLATATQVLRDGAQTQAALS